ncbi:MAG: hypothetical protein U9O94_06005 [Nanoarchaeota archaeon]|nr:hypothetical protein [Nanoarchaeota archaeon]
MENLTPEQIAFIALVVRQIAEFTAKAIPDTATGWKGVVRKICKVAAIYIVNKK